MPGTRPGMTMWNGQSQARSVYPPNSKIEGRAMKTFVVACVAAIVIAIGAVLVLDGVQKPVESAYKTTGVRI
jgi:hypothetical protein